ncbi:MAG TPA: phosphopantetheine-binding protein [Mobilitalea sp.]|nr:phosphopantetheine-binding protein [Mobilitalea sp.]
MNVIKKKMQEFNLEIEDAQISKSIDSCSFALGISSLQMVQLLLEIEDQFGIEIEIKPSSIEELVELVLSEDEG